MVRSQNLSVCIEIFYNSRYILFEWVKGKFHKLTRPMNLNTLIHIRSHPYMILFFTRRPLINRYNSELMMNNSFHISLYLSGYLISTNYEIFTNIFFHWKIKNLYIYFRFILQCFNYFSLKLLMKIV